MRELKPKDWFVALQHLPGIGYQTLLHLLPHILNLPPDLSSLRSILPAIPTISSQKLKTIYALNANQAFQITQSLNNKGIFPIPIFDENFPPLLREIADPPLILYAKGSIDVLKLPAIGIVGARKPSNYGRQISFRLGADLAARGFAIVSGMAKGIDSESHKGALSREGATIAVLGCGVDVIYPRQNKGLYEAIVKKGLVLSEFMPGSQPRPRLFPLRNRLISGLSLGVTVVEAAVSSGSLNTVQRAIEQNRDVFAVPGPISSPVSQGVNRLLREGAIAVTKVDDIVNEYSHLDLNLRKNDFSSEDKLSVNEKKILDIIENTEVSVDQLVRYTSLTAREVTRILLNLQLLGLARQLPGSLYTRCR